MSAGTTKKKKALLGAGEPLRVRYKPAECARLAGVSVRTVWNAIESGKLKAHRLGGDGSLGVLPRDLEAWVEGRST